MSAPLDTARASILLLPPAPAYAGESSKRYARELMASLAPIAAGVQRLWLEQPRDARPLSKLIDGGLTRRFDSAWTRYVAYPRSLRRREAALFHVLDHSDAHLLRSLDPERTVITCHDLIPILAAEGLIPVYVPPAVVRTYRWRIRHLARARAIIAVSHATKAALERYTSVRPERIAVVAQGVDSIFRPAPAAGRSVRMAADVSEAAAVVLQVASAGRYKNTPTLLRAFSRLEARLGRNVVLVRIGSPLYRDEAVLAEELGVLRRIRYLGAVDDQTLAAWYNAADVLAFPSWSEGFGWPPLEAMACGTPVVSSDVAALTELVADAAIRVPPGDPWAMAEALATVLTDPTRAESMRRRGVERASQFTWDRTAAGTFAVYQSMLQ